jgi:hypothetical protein
MVMIASLLTYPVRRLVTFRCRISHGVEHGAEWDLLAEDPELPILHQSELLSGVRRGARIERGVLLFF